MARCKYYDNIDECYECSKDVYKKDTHVAHFIMLHDNGIVTHEMGGLCTKCSETFILTCMKCISCERDIHNNDKLVVYYDCPNRRHYIVYYACEQCREIIKMGYEKFGDFLWV